VAGLEKSR